MPSALHDFRSQILRSTAKSIGHLVPGHLKLTKAEISQLNVAVRVKNYILGLEIPVNYPIPMQAFQCKNDLSCIKARSLLLEFCFFAQMEKQFTAIEEVDYKIESLGRLKSVVQLDNERMVDPFQNHSFHYSKKNLVRANLGRYMRLLTSSIGRLSLAQHHVFLQRLHCINVLVIFFLNKINFSERTSSYDFDDLEIFDTYVLRAVIRI